VIGGASIASVVHVDTSSVCFDAFSIEVSRYRASGVNLHHDVLISADRSKLSYLDGRVVGDGYI
jgi:hypothetical protein